MNDPGDPDIAISIEGPNATHCFRASVEMVKPKEKDISGKGGNGTKIRVTAAWQGDRKSAVRDAFSLKKAWSRGGFDEVYKEKTRLRDKRFGR